MDLAGNGAVAILKLQRGTPDEPDAKERSPHF